jgi:hypothetical protein
MARTQKTSTETTQDNGPVSTTNDDQTTPSGMARDRENTSSDSKKPMVIPDPRGIMSISLGDAPGSQWVHLRRSQKFKQLQMAFDERPDEKYLVKLREAGWTDRTESEGIWTRQVAPGRWQPVADAEKLFKEIANGIRQDKELEPVMGGLAMA